MSTKVIHDYTAAVSIDGAADYLLIDPSSTGTYKKINRNVLLGITSTPIGASDSQTLQNKTLDNTNIITVKDGSFTVQNTSDTTKRAVLSASGITTGTTRTLTLPNRTDTLVTLAGTETLTNKTLTSPVITGGTIDNATVTVDSISGHTAAGIVTVGGVQMSSGVVNTASSVTSTAIAVGAVQPQALTTGTGTGWTLSTWAPSWNNVTVGNGTLVAKYIQIGKVVHFYLMLTWGTTTSVSGEPQFSLPVNYNASYAAVIAGIGFVPIGTGNLSHLGNYSAMTCIGATNIGKWLAMNAGGTYLQPVAVSATVPATFATGDVFAAQGSYEVA